MIKGSMNFLSETSRSLSRLDVLSLVYKMPPSYALILT